LSDIALLNTRLLSPESTYNTFFSTGYLLATETRREGGKAQRSALSLTLLTTANSTSELQPARSWIKAPACRSREGISLEGRKACKHETARWAEQVP